MPINPQTEERQSPLKLLPRCCYCNNCGVELLRYGISYNVPLAGSSWGRVHFRYDNTGFGRRWSFDQEDYEHETLLEDVEYTCRDCQDPLELNQIEDIYFVIEKAKINTEEESWSPSYELDLLVNEQPYKLYRSNAGRGFIDAVEVNAHEKKGILDKQGYINLCKYLEEEPNADERYKMEFDKTNIIYQTLLNTIQNTEITFTINQETVTITATEEEPDPFNQRVITGQHHQRWADSGMSGIQCPNKECNKVLYDDGNVYICPDCLTPLK